MYVVSELSFKIAVAHGRRVARGRDSSAAAMMVGGECSAAAM